MVPTIENLKHARPVDKFSSKDHFNPLYVDRDILVVNGVDRINIEVLGVCVYETIV